MPLPLLALPALPALAPITAALRVVVDVLARMRLTINGLVVAGLVVACLVGSWWIARSARLAERQRAAVAHAAGVAKVTADLKTYVGVKTGVIAADDARFAAISAELKQMFASLPPEVRTETKVETRQETVYVPVPVGDLSAGKPSSRAAVPASPDRGDSYPDHILSKLNEINTRRAP